MSNLNRRKLLVAGGIAAAVTTSSNHDFGGRATNVHQQPGGLTNRRVPCIARVVDDDVEASESVKRCLNKSLRKVRMGNVAINSD